MSLASVTTRGFQPAGSMVLVTLMGYGAQGVTPPPPIPPAPASFGGPPWYYKCWGYDCDEEEEEAIEEAEEVIEEAVQILREEPKKSVAKQEKDFTKILARVTEVSRKEMISVWREEVQRRIQERQEEEDEMPIILSLIWGEQ